eukprot:4226088-Amphidinium_carterae.1
MSQAHYHASPRAVSMPVYSDQTAFVGEVYAIYAAVRGTTSSHTVAYVSLRTIKPRQLLTCLLGGCRNVPIPGPMVPNAAAHAGS